MAEKVPQQAVDDLIAKLKLWEKNGVTLRERRTLLMHLQYLDQHCTEDDVRKLYQDLGITVANDVSDPESMTSDAPAKKFVWTMAQLVGFSNDRMLEILNTMLALQSGLDALLNNARTKRETFEVIQLEASLASQRTASLLQALKRRRSWL